MDDKEEVLQKWKEIALEFRFVTAIKILQTDGDKHKKWGINLFPTIKYVTVTSLFIQNFSKKYQKLSTITNFFFSLSLDCLKPMRLEKLLLKLYLKDKI